ncbi:MAG: sugar ABC transporter permease [Acholeplasmataceae bacterium]|nr:sugar ABC transporter permease [Acholeplasmataceae bacterium]
MEDTIKKENWFKQKWNQFKDWKQRTSIKIDRWSRKKPLRRKIYLNRTLYLMMLPYVLLFTAFTIVPVIMSFGLSFTYFNMLEAPKLVWFNNYLTLFLDDEIFIIAIKNTLIIAIICGPGGYLMSFVMAWLINELPGKLRTIITLVFYAPSLSGNALSIWTIIFSSDIYGYANSFLIKFGFISQPITWLTNSKYILPIVIIVQLWMSLGVNFLSLIAGLKGCDKTLYEAAAVDGIRNRWQELWYITLPQLKPQLIFSAVIQISSALGVGSITTSLAGFPSVSYAGHTIVNHLTDYGSLRFEMGYASAIATLLFVASIGLNRLIQNLIRKVGD